MKKRMIKIKQRYFSFQIIFSFQKFDVILLFVSQIHNHLYSRFIRLFSQYVNV